MTSFLGEKTRKKYVVLIVTFDFIGLLPNNYIIVNDIWNKLLILQWHTGVCEEPFNVNRKIVQTMQNIWNCIVRESNLQELANFGDYPGDFSNLETGRNGLKSGVYLPDYPGELTALLFLKGRLALTQDWNSVFVFSFHALPKATFCVIITVSQSIFVSFSYMFVDRKTGENRA